MEKLTRDHVKKKVTFFIPLESVDKLAERAENFGASKSQLVHNLIKFGLLPEEIKHEEPAITEIEPVAEAQDD